MNAQHDALFMLVAALTLIASLWQGRSQAKQIKVLIEEREFEYEKHEQRDRERQEEHRVKTNILILSVCERVEQLRKQMEKMELDLKSNIKEIFSRLNKQ